MRFAGLVGVAALFAMVALVAIPDGTAQAEHEHEHLIGNPGKGYETGGRARAARGVCSWASHDAMVNVHDNAHLGNGMGSNAPDFADVPGLLDSDRQGDQPEDSSIIRVTAGPC